VKLAIIGRRLCEPLTGVGRYLEYLLRHWGHDSRFSRIVVFTPSEPNLRMEEFGPSIEFRVIGSRLPPLLWENVVLPAKVLSSKVVAAKAGGFDLIFAPYTLPWSLAERGVVSNLGIYESRPDDFSLSARLRSTPFFHHSCRKARLVLANSASTRDDLVRFYGTDPSKIRVVYPGVDPEFQPAGIGIETQGPQVKRAEPSSPAALSIPAEPFFLFVGKLSRRRNLPLLLEAFRQLKERTKLPHRLVIVGPDTSGVNVVDRAAAMSIGGFVDYRKYAAKAELIELYQAAAAFVLPTLHEGFSFTTLEAMACGAPVIVFDHQALEGGVRQAAFVVEEATAGALGEALQAVAERASLSEKLRQAGLDCAAGFSWRKTADETAAALVSCQSPERK